MRIKEEHDLHMKVNSYQLHPWYYDSIKYLNKNIAQSCKIGHAITIDSKTKKNLARKKNQHYLNIKMSGQKTSRKQNLFLKGSSKLLVEVCRFSSITVWKSGWKFNFRMICVSQQLHSGRRKKNKWFLCAVGCRMKQFHINF